MFVEAIEEWSFSFDLPQGGMEIPAKFTFKTENTELCKQMKEKMLEQIEKFKERRKISIDNSLKKKKTEFVGLIFVFLFSADRLKFSSNF